jgi:TatD DNase family protein
VVVIDTHCHLTSRQLEPRWQEVVDAAASAGVGRMITVATDPGDAKRALALAEQDSRVFCTAGIHPLHAEEQWDWEILDAVAGSDRCVAWGEMGLDRHYDDPPLALQARLLEEQLAHVEAKDGDVRPIIVHCRRAVDDLLPRFEASSIEPSRFVFHCFTEGMAEARRIIEFGAWIGFTGVVTFASAGEVAEAAAFVPSDRILAETDAPYLSPEPVRKIRPNEPKYVMHTAARLAALRNLPLSELEPTLDHNAIECFGLENR